MKSNAIITIEGRDFRGITQELSAAQDDFLIAHLQLAGCLPALRDIKADPETRAEMLLIQLMLSGRTHQVLAGCLTEEGKSWTFEEATRNAATFAAITDSESKAAMREAIVSFVCSFFLFLIQPVLPDAASQPRHRRVAARASPHIAGWEN
jgi:hypothetical protein